LTVTPYLQKIVEIVDAGVMKMDSLNNMELHRALKQMRQSRKLTQVKVAGEIGISTFTLIRWEREERAPDGGFLQKLASTLGYAVVLDTDGLWSCYPKEELRAVEEGQSISPSERVDEIYRMAAKAKDNAVWKVFFSRLVKENARLETWFRESNGGAEMDEKAFKIIRDVVWAMVNPER
jgi:transcriptional regulator with XRE-family HTH domain